MENLELIATPVIVSINYVIIVAYKRYFTNSKIAFKLLPLISLVLGVTISVLAYYLMPCMMLEENILYVILTGLASGVVAIGRYHTTSDKDDDDNKQSDDNTQPEITELKDEELEENNQAENKK